MDAHHVPHLRSHEGRAVVDELMDMGTKATTTGRLNDY